MDEKISEMGGLDETGKMERGERYGVSVKHPSPLTILLPRGPI